MKAIRSASSVLVLETDRLTLRRFTPDDAEFILDLLNEPSFLRHIGDKGVRTGVRAGGLSGRGRIKHVVIAPGAIQ
jgi:hypothetical protein